jgi:hypothetical protein
MESQSQDHIVTTYRSEIRLSNVQHPDVPDYCHTITMIVGTAWHCRDVAEAKKQASVNSTDPDCMTSMTDSCLASQDHGMTLNYHNLTCC